VLLVLGLLGGGLVCLLIVNTTLATAQFRINNLQQSNTQLSQQEQGLQQQIATDEAPGTIEKRAFKLGLRQQQRLNFLDVQTGRIYRQPLTTDPSVPPIPGFTP
jgi:Tfp pilus assembly protein PilN